MDMEKMTFEEVVILLQLNHIYPITLTELGKDGKKITGLEVPVNPFTYESKKGHIEQVVKERGFRVDYLSNQQILYITKLKSKK
jgi:hypothetical protein